MSQSTIQKSSRDMWLI